MKLRHVQVEGFRSIEKTTLKECGGFNVLVGKNNAGKSNLLLAIDAFFSVIQQGSVTTLHSKYSDSRNYAKGSHESRSFVLKLTFRMSDAERSKLVADIKKEQQQVAIAAEQINNAEDIVITVAFIKDLDGPFVQSIEIPGAEGMLSLLNISEIAARELLENMSQLQKLANTLEEFSELPKEFSRASSFESIKKNRDYLRHAAYGLRRGSYEPILELLERAETLEEFEQAIEQERNVISGTIAEIRTKSLKNFVGTFGGQSDRVPGYAERVLLQIASHKVLYLTERREPIGMREATLLLKLKVRRGGTTQLRRIQDVVSALLGVQIDAFQSEASSRARDGDAELDVDDFHVQVNGAGIREALRLILDYEFEQPQILLVEEPEIHLHPALESSMMRYLKACGQNSQIFITTHSTNFLDTAELENVYLISRSPTTNAELLSCDDAESKIPKELGIRLSSLFMFDRLVFVEGPSDEEVLREIASILDVNLAHTSVGFVPMGGVRNLAYFAAESTLDFLSKRQVKMWFVIDRDEREDADLKKLAQRLGNRAKLVTLSKREIENYLVDIPALCKFIVFKKRMAGGIDAREPANDEVRAAVSECADKLKEIAIERRVMKSLCIPLYPDRGRIQLNAQNQPIADRMEQEFAAMSQQVSQLRGQLANILTESRQTVEVDWEQKKLAIVPGDSLIDDVCRIFGVRFKKASDSSRLAGYLSQQAIDQELRTLIDELARPEPDC